MGKVRFRISMSLDGYVAGPRQSVKDPIGVGGMRLHEWVFPLAAWRSMQGMEGGEVNESTRIVEESIANVGATVMGRNMFGGGPGPWSLETPWNGWWGDNPPYHHPVFVLTHHERPALALEGGTTFHFVTQGPEAALDAARRAGGARDVMVAGGAKAAQQYLTKGAVDEMDISLVPILLGAGERLFEGLDSDMHGLKLVRTIAAADVTHLKYAR